MDSALSDLDNRLGVSVWGVPGGHADPMPEREEGAPDWWYGAEEASQAFLAIHGQGGRL